MQNNTIEAMCWGSCQYDAAAEVYHELLKTEKEVGRTAILELYNQQLGIALSAESVYNKLVANMKINWDGDEGDQEIYDLIIEVVAQHAEKTITNCFNICRSMSWDLWTAVPAITRLVFPLLDLDKTLRRSKDKTKNPLLHQSVQSYNGSTGFCCWLLKSFGYAEEEDFMEFDT